MKYLKVWTNFKDVLERLEDDEIGRLFVMMLDYAETGEIPQEFPGNECFIFPVAKQMIDLAAEKVETLRQNGAKGGLAKSKNKQMIANDSKSYQPVANATKEKQNVAYKEMKRNEMKCNEMESSFIGDDDAKEIQLEQNRVLDAAADAGFPNTNNVRAALIALYAEYSLDRLLEGIKSCSEHSAVNLAYLRAVLKGGNKPVGKPVKVLPAQDFEQRSYDGVNEEIMRDLERRMDEFQRTGEVG